MLSHLLRGRGRWLLVLVVFTPTALPAQAVPASPSRWPANWAVLVDSMVRAWQADTRAPGVSVAVGVAGRVVHQSSIGVLDHTGEAPVTDASVFHLGSVSKQVTAALVLRLVAEGRVQLGEPIGRHVPGLPEAWRVATIEQLLNHTSGIPSFTELGATWTQRWSEPMAPRALLALGFDAPMWFPPGARWRYDNAGYVLLGLLLEALYGRSWTEIVREQVAAAHALPTLGSCAHDAADLEMARGHSGASISAAPQPAPALHISHAYAAGDLCASAPDLVRWSFLLFGDDFLPLALRDRMRTPIGAARAYRYGFAMRNDSLDRLRVLLHDGDIPGFSAATVFAPSGDLAIAVLANRDQLAPEQFALSIARVLLGLPEPAPDLETPLDDPTRRLSVGRYLVSIPGDTTEISIADDRSVLALRIRGGRAWPLVYFGRRRSDDRESLLFGVEFDPTLRLQLDIESDRVVGGLLRQAGGHFTVERIP